MQTLAVQVEDNFIDSFMDYIRSHKESITVANDDKLQDDPFFFHRQEKLRQIREEVHNGKMKLLTQEESDQEIDEFLVSLEKANENSKN
jgi:hypothetical protein